MGRALIVTGTSSSAGKSTLVSALGRVLADQGVKVAPFKGQNMALNSMVTRSGHEIARAQYTQSLACRTEAVVEMNPVLLKPTSEHSSQVVVMGRPMYESSGVSYQLLKKQLRATVEEALEELLGRYDFVLLEGAGSPAEINLMSNDLVNLGLAKRFNIPSILVGDIERGGVFASIFGTLQILPPELSELIFGFVINKFRGQKELLKSGIVELEERLGVTSYGVLPYLALDLPEEDSLFSYRQKEVKRASSSRKRLRVSVLRFPYLSNASDFDPLILEDDLEVIFTDSPSDIKSSDLVVLPGSKCTVADLNWIRECALDDALSSAQRAGSVIFGVCGGFQMLGGEIKDGVESEFDSALGLCHLPITTTFQKDKVLRRIKGVCVANSLSDRLVSGYQIHMGIIDASGASPLFRVRSLSLGEGGEEFLEGAVSASFSVFGTTIHGIFECDGFRAGFLSLVAQRVSKSFTPSLRSYKDHLEESFDRLADVTSREIDVAGIFEQAKRWKPKESI